jgi:hypothetical protein
MLIYYRLHARTITTISMNLINKVVDTTYSDEVDISRDRTSARKLYINNTSRINKLYNTSLVK